MLFRDLIHPFVVVNRFGLLVSFPPGHDQYVVGGGGAGGGGAGGGGDGFSQSLPLHLAECGSNGPSGLIPSLQLQLQFNNNLPI